jgi:SpoVK/Ycf46/Vps4 family AAA+-type ATPase
MIEMALRPQIMVLIHGLPGTGKTEFVYQVARSTGRNIKRVEISETKNHFFGNSEKLTLKIFRDFATLRQSTDTDIEPILFVNEIDGWLGQRTIGGNSSIDQTQNSIQSIILQNFEEFEGILFGCCNLINRLDTSYMRRFGFKIELKLPDQECRYNIFRSRLPDLPNDQLHFLSETYQLSGGMIDNVIRKISMKQILTGSNPDLKQIEEFCLEEFIVNPFEKRGIGYLK